MARTHSTEVLVVGAGPVGLLTAVLLADQGVRVEIVDEESRPTVHTYALAIHPRSLLDLDRAHLADRLVEAGRRVPVLTLYDGPRRRDELRFAELPHRFPFALALPQSALEDLLLEALGAHGVEVKWNHRVRTIQLDDGGVTTEIDRLQRVSGGYAVSSSSWAVATSARTRARFVVGADGHNSTVRRRLDLAFEERGPAELFAVFEFSAPEGPRDEASLVLDAAAVSALWPLPSGRFRWSFQLRDGREILPPGAGGRTVVQIGQRAFPSLAEERVRALMAERAPWFDARVSDVTWSAAVRFERRLAGAFGRDTAWLVGDAAHLTGPLGAQSMNVGLHEAATLVDALLAVLLEGAPASRLLDYGASRRNEWGVLLGGEGACKPSAATPGWLADRRSALLPSVPASGDDLAALLRQVGLELVAPAS